MRGVLLIFLSLLLNVVSAFQLDNSSPLDTFTVEEKYFDPDEFIKVTLNLLEYSSFKVKPAIEVNIDKFRITSPIPITVSNVKHHKNGTSFQVMAYSDEGIPRFLKDGSLEIYQNDKKIDFTMKDYEAADKTMVFDLLLDDSGSMGGDRINRLVNVVEEFMKRSEGKGYLCRITWFSSTYQVMNSDYQECGTKYFGSITPRGEYGGTIITPALRNAYTSLDHLDDSKYMKAVLLVGDGDDSSMSAEYASLKIEKGEIKTFVYVIDDYTGHSFNKIADFVMYQEEDFDKQLFQYMLAMELENKFQNHIWIKK